MIAFGRRATGAARRRELPLRDGAVGSKGEWMDCGNDKEFSPTVFLIEQPPGATISAHFHHNNQFQVFVEGSGKIGGRALEPIIVHYAGAYTAYGPLLAGPEGLHYFTLRTVCEQGAIVVARSEGRWPKGPRRHATSKTVERLDPARLAALSASRTSVVLPLAEDGLYAASIAFPPGTIMPAVDIGTGEGLFLMLIAGSAEILGERLASYESIYLSPQEAFPTIRACDEGAQMLALVPPHRDPAYPPFD